MLKQKNIITVSRQELYDLVWSRPIMNIAKDFGISDRGLGRVCERYNIPKPPRGYWQKIAAGARGEKPKLPAIKNASFHYIHIRCMMQLN